jgi:two-component system sensor histidine kinase HydH
MPSSPDQKRDPADAVLDGPSSSGIRFDDESTGESSAERDTLAAERLIQEARETATSPDLKVPPPPGAAAKFGALAASALVVYGCMIMTPKPMDALSDVWQRVFYLPVAAASLMLGFRAGLTLAAFAAGLCLWRVQDYWGGDFFGANLNRTIEAGLIVVVGGLTGYLSELSRRERHRAASAGELLERASRLLLSTSRDLRRSIAQLKRGAYETIATQERLQRADRLAALGTLTAGLAHEIRNPLGSIRGTAEILADRAGDDSVAREFIGILIKETDRLNDVLTNFLRFARGSRSHGDCADARAATVDALELVDLHLARSGIRVERYMASGTEPLEAAISGASLRQALLNLLLNACQALADWKGDRVVQVHCGACEQTGRICVEVADSGPGIPEAVRAKIFDPFFTTKEKGTGLGLAIAARIADDARGELTLMPPELSPLGGARFVLKLPRAQATPPPAFAKSGPATKTA